MGKENGGIGKEEMRGERERKEANEKKVRHHLLASPSSGKP